MSAAPLGLFTYNRPLHTQRALDALRRCIGAGDTDLYVFSDAPKTPEASPAVAQVRALLERVEGFQSVTIVKRNVNAGLAVSIGEGVTRLCDEFGRAIVVEDDLLVSPHFLHFMNAGLDAYAGDERVMQVAGYMFPVDLGEAPEDALFLPMTTSWGWATWRRAWAHYDASASGHARLVADPALRSEFDLRGAAPYFGMLEDQLSGKVDSWAIRWYLSVFLHRGLVLFPRKTLVENIGFDGSGTHGTRAAKSARISEGFRVDNLPRTAAVSPVYEKIIAHFRGVPQPRWKQLARRLIGR